MELCGKRFKGVHFIQRSLELGVHFRRSQVERGLKVQPGLRITAKIPAQAQGGISCDPSPLQQDVVDPGCRYSQMSGQGVATHVQWLQKILAQNFAGVHRAHSVFRHVLAFGFGVCVCRGRWSMVINDLNLGRTFVSPYEADAPLAVDPDTVLSQSVTRQPFEVITRRAPEELQGGRSIQLCQFSFGGGLDAAESPGPSRCKQAFSVSATKGLNGHLNFIPNTGIRDEECCLFGREEWVLSQSKPNFSELLYSREVTHDAVAYGYL